MAIVKMKKIRLLALRSQKEAILRELMLLGCVEVSEPDVMLSDPELVGAVKRETADTDVLRSEYASLARSIEVIKQYVPKKTSMFALRPEVTQKKLLDEDSAAKAVELAKSIEVLDSRIRRLLTEENNEHAAIESLQPWLGLRLPLNTDGTRTAGLLLGHLPVTTDIQELNRAFEDADAIAQVFVISSGKEQHNVSVVYLRQSAQAVTDTLRRYSFSHTPLKSVTGTAEENIKKSEEKIREFQAERNSIIEKITFYASRLPELQLSYDHMATRIARAETAEKLVGTKSSLMLTGWLAAPREKDLSASLSRYVCAWELEDPAPEENEEIPVKLENNRVTRSLNMVTEMYSLPAYRGVDPNPLMAPFFIFFYGMMMADMGYGLLMILAGLFVAKAAKPRGTMKQLFELMKWCGITTFIVGAMTGSFFGDAPAQVAQIINPGTTWQGLPALFNPLDDALMILVGSLGLGLIQIITGMAISFVKQIKRGEVMAALCNEGAWFLVFVIFGVAAVTGMWTPCLYAIIALLILTQSYGKKGIIGRVMGIFGSLYNNVTGYFSDILSYSRLMALMLAGAVIAQVFNTLGAITGNILLFLIISIIGNALNFALNLLGCFVHDLRLQCLEYFGRFYEDGGKPFKPLEISTVYHDIIND